MKTKKEEFIAVYGIPTIDIDKDAFVNDLNEVIAEAIAEREAGAWHYKKPRSNDKTMWGKQVLVERSNYIGEHYFSTDTMPLLGKIIRWCELPAPYREKGGE